MTRFLQLHSLTAYPAGNPNRDDAGRPKTMIYGGAERLRLSSQSLKRAIRTSAAFAERVEGALGVRSAHFAAGLAADLQSRGVTQADAQARVEALIAHDRLGKVRPGRPQTEGLVHLGPDELRQMQGLTDRLVRDEGIDDKAPLVLRQTPRAADIAMFGRMLADQPAYTVEAAVQVAHAFTTHRGFVEDDYFTAIDDLGAPGAAYVGLNAFGAGLFYNYLCVDTGLLVENLAGDRALCADALEGLLVAALTSAPGGRRASYATHVKSAFALLEIGEETPRTLGGAFLYPVGERPGEEDLLEASIRRLQALRAGFATAYGERFETILELNLSDPASAPLTGLIQAARACVEAPAVA